MGLQLRSGQARALIQSPFLGSPGQSSPGVELGDWCAVWLSPFCAGPRVNAHSLLLPCFQLASSPDSPSSLVLSNLILSPATSSHLTYSPRPGTEATLSVSIFLP